MSSGAIHNRVTKQIAVSGGIGVAIIYSNIYYGIALAIGCLLGIIITPDWDIDNGTNANKHMRKVGLGWFLSHLIRPYAVAYKHRSTITHKPIFSTLWRIIYMYVPFVVLVNADQSTNKLTLIYYSSIAQILAFVVWWVTWYFWFMLCYYWLFVGIAIVGLMLSDIAHWLFDL